VHNGQTPSSQWTTSSRKWDGKVPAVIYPDNARLYKVQHNGDIYPGTRLFLSEALQGEYVMMKEVDDGLYMVLFDRLILAYYDKAEHCILRID
jgi:hypothetical protein